MQNGQTIQQTYAYSVGEYSFDTDSNTVYNVQIDTTGIPFALNCPISGEQNVTLTNADSMQLNQNFGLNCRGIDLGVLSIYGRFRVGTHSTVNINAGDIIKYYYNANCASNVAGTVTITLNGSISYVAPAFGALTPTAVTGNTLSYAISDFSAIPVNAFDFVVATDTYAISGSLACINVNVSTATDINLANNALTQCFTIFNSYDPNAKEVYPTTVKSAGGWLTYTVHFQNTGNDTAYTITVRDTMSNAVDVGTFQFLASSHDKHFIQLKGNAVSFLFPQINLVDSATNAIGSQGWFQFRVKAKSNLTPQTAINNTAYIYFDFNAAIVTNTATANVCSPSYSSFKDTICGGGSRTYNGITLTQSGAYNDTLINISGCDSIITLNLFVRPLSSKSLFDSICNGSSRVFNGFTITQSGTYKDTLTSVSGCDSILTLNLFVRPVISKSIFDSICNGSSRVFNGLTLTQRGTYKDTLTSITGCDSILTLNLFVRPLSSKSIFDSICNGSSRVFNGLTLTQSGAYKDTLTNVSGCDSIITLNLFVRPLISKSIFDSICNGSSRVFNGLTLTQSGAYKDTLTSVLGCDSIITLNLFVKPTSSKSIFDSICNGSSKVFNGMTLTQSGAYKDTLTSVLGCDSIITLHLFVKPTSSKTIFDSICNGSSRVFNGLTLTQNGTYKDTLTSVSGCDSIITLNLFIKPTSSKSIFDSICNGSSRVFNGLTLTQSGIYKDTLTNTSGCDSIVSLYLTIKPTPDTPSIVRNGNQLVTTYSNGYTYSWYFNNQPIVGQKDSILTITQNGLYTVAVIAPNNCGATAKGINITNVGIQTLNSYSFSVYPNPNKGSFTLLAPNNIGDEWSVVDVLGRTNANGFIRQESEFIQLNENASGVYILKCGNQQIRLVIRD